MISEKNERFPGSSGSSKTGERKKYIYIYINLFFYTTDIYYAHNLSSMLTFGVFVTKRRGPHVTEAQGSLAAAVHKQVAVLRVKLCCCYHLRQILHVGGFDVYNV